MISPATIDLIERLFRAGRDFPTIATAAGCCEQTVRRVIGGKHGLQLRPRRRPGRDENPEARAVAPIRCPGCGGLLSELPCRLCLVAPETAGALESPRSVYRRSEARRRGINVTDKR